MIPGHRLCCSSIACSEQPTATCSYRQAFARGLTLELSVGRRKEAEEAWQRQRKKAQVGEGSEGEWRPGIGAEGAAEPEPRRAARLRARDARRKRHHKGMAEKLLLRVVRKFA